jgi:hypothetical protein
MRRKCEATISVDASPEAIWAVISDVTRTGEWSGECQGGIWVGDATAPAPGVRFRGRNRRGRFRWTRLNEVIEAQPPRTLVWRTLRRAPYPDSVEWRLTLAQEGDTTRVDESFQVLKLPRVMEASLWLLMPSHRDRTSDLAEDLNRLKALVESEARHPPI